MAGRVLYGVLSVMNEQAQRYCHTCQRPVLATRTKPNHVLHFLVTMFTCGLWAFVWLFISLAAREPWRCQVCGDARLA